MLAQLRSHKFKFLFACTILALVWSGLGIHEALSADADLQQYNGSAVWADDLTVASTLLPRDGKRITADSNAVGSAPVNRSLKQLKDYLSATHGGIFGVGSATRRTVKSLEADGTGGNISSLLAGGIASSTSTDRSLMTPTDVAVFKISPTGGETKITKGAVTFTNTADGGGNPARTTSVNNAVIPLNIPKSWARVFTDAMGNLTIVDGYNLTSCVASAPNYITCTMAVTLDSTNYLVMNSNIGGSPEYSCSPLTASTFRCEFYNTVPAPVDCSSDACALRVVVFGRQTT